MSRGKQSPIFVKTYDFLVWLLGRTARFPKNERFRLAKRLEESAFAFHDLLLQAGRLPASQTREKKRLLVRADLELDRLRFTVRLCQDLKLFSFKQYEYCAERLVEIGRLLAGTTPTTGTTTLGFGRSYNSSDPGLLGGWNDCRTPGFSRGNSR